MSLPGFLQALPNGYQLLLKVQPRASRDEIGPPMGAELKVKVTAPPVDSAANEAVLRLLAEQLGLARGAVQLVRGLASRHKVVQIVAPGLEPAELCRKLGVTTGSGLATG